MTSLRCLVVVPLLLLAGYWADDKDRYPQKTKDVLTGATKVEVFRIDGGENGPKPKVEGEKRIGGFRVIAQGKDRGKDFAGKLANLLLDKKTYEGDFANCFWPGVAFRIWKGEESIDVLICFKCQNFYCGPPTADAHENATFSKSPRRADLVRLAKEVFPDDKDIQGLKE